MDATLSAERVLASIRQGAVVRGPAEFVVLGPPPLSGSARWGQEKRQEVEGLVLTSQTCDVTRAIAKRPYLEFCPLAKPPIEHLEDCKKRKSSRYAVIAEHLTLEGLFADLDRSMTVEKLVAATWQFVEGPADDEARAFARALGAKRQRAAFPDELRTMLARLCKELGRKNLTDAVKAIEALAEIRVRPVPGWGAADVIVDFMLVSDASERLTLAEASRLPDDFKRLLAPNGRFNVGAVTLTTLAAMTALDYLTSDHVELDYLTP